MIVEPVVTKLEEVCVLLDHIAGLLETQIRLLRLLVEEDRIVFEADEPSDGEALTA